LNFVCSWCEHLHNAVDRSSGENISVCGEKCGGPLAGKAFPEYKGPLGGNLSGACFLCGGEPTASVSIGGGMLGICESMGPYGEKCIDKLKKILEKKMVIVKEHVVPLLDNG